MNIFNLAQPIRWWILNRFPPNLFRSIRRCVGSIPDWNDSSSHRFYLFNLNFKSINRFLHKLYTDWHLILNLRFLPLRTNECPSLIKPDSISMVKLTDLFLEKLSTLTCSTNFSICSSVNCLLRNWPIFLISFLISLNEKRLNLRNTFKLCIKFNKLMKRSITLYVVSCFLYYVLLKKY